MRMEANFPFNTDMPDAAFFGLVSSLRMKRLFKLKDDEFIHIMESFFGEVFLEAKHKFLLNMDVVTMVVAWGLELGDSIENVEWVVWAILDYEWLVGLNSSLEWAIPGADFYFSECFEDQRMADLHELVPLYAMADKI